MMPLAFCVTAPEAFKISADPAAPVVTAALIAIVLAAVSVNVFVDAQVIASTTVILPAPAPAALVVVTTMFELPSAVFNTPVVNSESLTAPVA